MNCKPNDLAVIYRVTHPSVAWVIGKVVRVVTPTKSPRANRDAWYLETPVTTPSGDKWDCVCDDILRPIRDPGDDAVDESTAWLPPVPSRIEESA